jgi:hypothetical protein
MFELSRPIRWSAKKRIASTANSGMYTPRYVSPTPIEPSAVSTSTNTALRRRA